MKRRLAVANIGFNMNPEVSNSLRNCGIDMLEIAPIRGIEFGNMPVWSLQSFMHAFPITNIFMRPATFLCHCRNIIRRGSALGIQRFVFDATKQRTLTTSTADAIDLFRKVGNIAAEYNVLFCIEAQPQEYGCTWLNTLGEVLEFVQAVEHPNIRINLDSGNFRLANDPFPLESLDLHWVGHVQISAPHLHYRLSVEDMVVAKRFRTYLDINGYNGVISFEAKQAPTFQEYLQGIHDFLHIFP